MVRLIRSYSDIENQIYTLCNGRDYTTKEIQLALQNRTSKRIVRLPVPVKVLMLARKLRLPYPFKSDQIERLVMPKSSDNSAANEDFGFAPVPFTEAIEQGLVNLEN